MTRSTEARLGRLLLVASLGAVLFATDCTSNHDSLAARPRSGSGGSAGSSATGGSGGLGGAAARGGSSAQGGTGGTGGSGGNKVVEPPGESVLTLLHAVVNTPSLAFCFARDDGSETTLVGDPRPAGGLAYGASLVLDQVSGVDFEQQALVPFALAGELELLAGLDCEASVALAEAEMADATRAAAELAGGAGGEGGAATAAGAGMGGSGGDAPKPPRLRVGRLPAIAAGTLTEGYSLLFAAVGCLGGPTFTTDHEKAICGELYTPLRPTLSAELVLLSRKTASGVVGMQALHASTALGQISIRAVPPDTTLEAWASIGEQMTEGALRPLEPRLDLAPAGYGIGTRTWRVQALDNGTVAISDSWSVVLARSGASDPEIGRGYTLVAMGPKNDEGRGWWNAAGFTIVDNDPSP